MSDLCISAFTGRLTKDPEVKYTTGEKPTAIVEFDLAVQRGFGTREKANFFHMVMYGKAAENFSKYAKKGAKLAVHASPEVHTWQSKEGRPGRKEVHVVSDWHFIETKAAQQQYQARQNQDNDDEDETPIRPSNSQPWMNISDDFAAGMPFM